MQFISKSVDYMFASPTLNKRIVVVVVVVVV